MYRYGNFWICSLLMIVFGTSSYSVCYQQITQHGKVVNLEGSNVEVNVTFPWRVSADTEGVILTENNNTAAHIKVLRVSGTTARCEILGVSETHAPQIGMDVFFERVSEIQKGTLEVRSTPQGAAVQLQEKYVGNTPLKESLYPGNYLIRLSKSGYDVHEKRVNIKSGETSSITVQLEKKKEIEEGQPVEFYIMKGTEFYDAGNYRKAKLYFEKAMELRPDDTFTSDFLNRTEEAQKQQEREEEERKRREEEARQREAEQQRQLEESHAWRLAADKYMELEEYDNAQAYIEKILGLLPDDEEAKEWQLVLWRSRVQKSLDNRSYGEAESYIEKIIELWPEDRLAWDYRIKIWRFQIKASMLLEEWHEARCIVDQLLKRMPEDEEAQAWLHQIRLAQGELKGTVIFQTNPESTVFIDGNEMGNTPLKLELDPGKYEIIFKFTQSNVEDQREMVEVVEDQVYTIERDFTVKEEEDSY